MSSLIGDGAVELLLLEHTLALYFSLSLGVRLRLCLFKSAFDRFAGLAGHLLVAFLGVLGYGVKNFAALSS